MKPTLEREAAHLYQQIEPPQRDDETWGWVGAYLCRALMKPIEKFAAWALDQGARPGYSVLMDLDECPDEALPWLSQFNGTVLDPTLTPGEWRRQIREARGRFRGTTRSLESDVKATLTGTKRVNVFPRSLSPFRELVVTAESETPDSAVTLAAVNDPQGRPFWMVYELIVSDIWIVAELERAYTHRSIAEFEAAFATVAEVETHEVL